ncbi:MAG: type II toxin-antitoxin system HipA family toxin YjjJ [Luteolibacter sp.]
MARPPRITRESLSLLIRARGPVSATELASALRANRTTIIRTLPDFGSELVTLGATRSTRYLLRRSLRNIGNRWPVYRIDPDGQAREWAEIEALHERHWRVNWADEAPEWIGHFTHPDGLWMGFPFFLGDARPQGFLGRAIARQISVPLQLPEDPRLWNGDEDILVYLQSSGEDLPGNLVVGDDCLRRALTRSVTPSTVPEEERATHYLTQATQITLLPISSSAGGEQPKFLTTLENHGEFSPVIVKFTAPTGQPTARRWADLLVCELHAHEVLAGSGLATAGTRLLDAGDRRFLEIPRFDRQGAGGRLGVVSLEALYASAIGGHARDWIHATRELYQEGLLDESALATVRRLQAFGELIGNSDMHFGNLAFRLEDTLHFQVTPSYDMLPMLWAPGPQGELVERPFSPAPPLPAEREPWRIAAVWAEDFWNRVTSDERISPDFSRIAHTALATVRQLRRHVG